jgi:cytochrome c-type biogenesis protein CcmH/NrfG
MPEYLRNKSLDDVAKEMAETFPNTREYQWAVAEFYRRQTLAIQETAAATKKYVRYMLISVLLLLISVIGSLLFSYLNYIKQ